MKVKLPLILTLVMAIVLPAASILAWQNWGSSKVPMSPEYSKDLAVEYVLRMHPQLKIVKTPSSWAFEDLTPENWLGYSTWLFKNGGWSVKVGSPVVQEPVYHIEIEYLGEINFTWKGTVDQGGNIVETDFVVN